MAKPSARGANKRFVASQPLRLAATATAFTITNQRVSRSSSIEYTRPLVYPDDLGSFGSGRRKNQLYSGKPRKGAASRRTVIIMKQPMLSRLSRACLLALLPLVAQAQQPDADTQNQLIQDYCTKCHNEEDWAGSLDLTLLDVGNAPNDAAIWEKVVRKFKGSMMPPLGNDRPTAEQQDAFIAWVTHRIDSTNLANPDPGKSSLHRLNRTEYGNAVRDLLGLTVDISEFLPADDEGYGFDNIADVLRTSPSLLEQYLSASRKISELAIGDTRLTPISKVYRTPPDQPQQHIPGLPLGTRGGILVQHNFPVDGEYQFNSYLTRNIVGYMTGLEWPNIFEISIDGVEVFRAQVGGEADNLANDTNFAEAADAIDLRLQTRIPVTAGLHQVAVTWQQKNAAETHEPLELHTRDLDLQNMNGLPILDYTDIIGPFNVTGAGDTASRRHIFSCYPQQESEAADCASEILATIGKRAYRRPLTDEDMNLIFSFYEDGAKEGSFELGIQTALRFILASPEFLFRSEPDPENVAPGEIYALNDLALASRLSFFLWSSIPDDTLIDLAAAGTLGDDAVFDAQVERMLRDPKAVALVDNWAAQWLFLRNLKSINPDTRTFPNFDDKLRDAFYTETSMFIQNIIHNDRPVTELLTADYTYVNDRLAQHYGIPNVYGSHFRRVAHTNTARHGLLGHGSVLTVTSYPNRTSPVLRGKWVLENIMGSAAAAPPPNVPALDEQLTAVSVRDRLIEHRKDPVCAGCHAVMDPLGFSLENFDAIGRFRERDQSGLIDSTGNLADGTPVVGASSLQQALLRKPDHFVDTVTEKLLTYALGRGLEAQDMSVVRAITRQAEADDYRFSALVRGIVHSVPFRMKKAAAPVAQTAAINN
jgi:hypothetical protein